jgi:hypothetical protein
LSIERHPGRDLLTFLRVSAGSPRANLTVIVAAIVLGGIALMSARLGGAIS